MQKLSLIIFILLFSWEAAAKCEKLPTGNYDFSNDKTYVDLSLGGSIGRSFSALSSYMRAYRCPGSPERICAQALYPVSNSCPSRVFYCMHGYVLEFDEDGKLLDKTRLGLSWPHDPNKFKGSVPRVRPLLRINAKDSPEQELLKEIEESNKQYRSNQEGNKKSRAEELKKEEAALLLKMKDHPFVLAQTQQEKASEEYAKLKEASELADKNYGDINKKWAAAQGPLKKELELENEKARAEAEKLSAKLRYGRRTEKGPTPQQQASYEEIKTQLALVKGKIEKDALSPIQDHPDLKSFKKSLMEDGITVFDAWRYVNEAGLDKNKEKLSGFSSEAFYNAYFLNKTWDKEHPATGGSYVSFSNEAFERIKGYVNSRPKLDYRNRGLRRGDPGDDSAVIEKNTNESIKAAARLSSEKNLEGSGGTATELMRFVARFRDSLDCDFDGSKSQEFYDENTLATKVKSVPAKHNNSK